MMACGAISDGELAVDFHSHVSNQGLKLRVAAAAARITIFVDNSEPYVPYITSASEKQQGIIVHMCNIMAVVVLSCCM
jgi:hypothetical protein